MYLFSTLVPIFALIAVGYVIVKRGFIAEGSIKDFNAIVYYIGLPAMLFYRIGQSSVDFSIAAEPFLLCLLSIFVVLAAGSAALWARKQKVEDFGTTLQVAFRGNTMFIGLPVIVYFFESLSYPDLPYINSLAMLSLSVVVPINNVFGVLVFVVGRDTEKGFFKVMIANMMKNPIILSCIAGIIYSSLFDGFPVPIARTFEVMSGMTLPLSLLAVGCILAEIKISDNYVDLAVISLIKLILMPAAVYAAGRAMHFGAESIAVAMILMACPTGSTCVTLAQQLGGDVKLTSTAIFGTSLLSAVSLIFVLMLCKSLFN